MEKIVVNKNETNFKKIITDKKRILVTGGAGFIGANLIKKLLKRGSKVICMDNLFSSKKENIYAFMDNKNFEYIRHDVTGPFTIEVDEIYNLACPASPIYYQKDPVYTIKTSFYGALNVLENAKRTGARVLQASTSEIYGTPEVHPQREDYWGNVNPIGPRSCYDEGKRAAECLFFDYLREYNTDIKVVRIFNTFGPGMSPNDGRVISNFILQALHDENITIYGNGSQTRSFCYVDDLTEGLIKMMKSEKECNGPINLGNTGEISILSLAEKIKKLTASRSKIIFLPLPENDPRRRKPDISMAREKLNWEPVHSVEYGLQKTVDYFHTLIENNTSTGR